MPMSPSSEKISGKADYDEFGDLLEKYDYVPEELIARKLASPEAPGF